MIYICIEMASNNLILHEKVKQQNHKIRQVIKKKITNNYEECGIFQNKLVNAVALGIVYTAIQFLS